MMDIFKSNLVPGRLDLSIMEAYRQTTNIPHLRQLFLSGWQKQPEITALALSSISGAVVTPAEDDAAMATITDYFMEPYYLPSMSIAQADAYFTGLGRKMCLDYDEGLSFDDETPLIIETLHHQTTFSALYMLCRQLTLKNRYDRIILLRRRQDFDARLEVMQTLARRVFNTESELISVSADDWLQCLLRSTKKRSVILCFGDIAPALFPQYHRPSRTSSTLRLYLSSGLSESIEGFSIAARLARTLRARHWVMDYPEPDRIRVAQSGDSTKLHCSMAQWVFWPALSLFAIGRHIDPGDPTSALETA